MFAPIEFIEPTQAATIGAHTITVAYYKAYIHNDHDIDVLWKNKGEWKFGLRSQTLDYIESPRGRLSLYTAGNDEKVYDLDDDLTLLWYFSDKTWFKLRAQEYDSVTDPLGWLEEPVWVDYTSEVQINVDVMVGANILHSGEIKQGDVTHYYRYSIVNFAPTARAIQDKLAYAGVPLQFYGSGSDPDGDSVSYEWKFGDGTTSEAQNPIHTYKDVGNYTISFRVKDALGAYSEYQIANVEVTAIVIDQMFVTDNRCNVDSVQTIGFHTKWAHSELLRSSDVVGGSIYVNGIEYVTNGTGWATLDVASDSVGMLWWNITEINCAGITEVVQEVANASIIWDKVTVTLSVENDILELGSTAKTTYTAVHQFDEAKFRGTITLNDTLTKSVAGTYYYTTASISRDTYGITVFESNTIAITFVDTTAPVANAGQNQTVNVGDTVTFDASNSTDKKEIISYEWDFGDETTGTGMTTEHIYTESGNYNVTLTVKDAAGNSATDTVTITVEAAAAPIPLWILGSICVVVAAATIAAALLLRRRRTHKGSKTYVKDSH